jgi:hypothetical protein
VYHKANLIQALPDTTLVVEGYPEILKNKTADKDIGSKEFEIKRKSGGYSIKYPFSSGANSRSTSIPAIPSIEPLI